MSDYETLLKGAKQRLDDLSTFDFMRVPQEESPTPTWLATAEGLAYLEALQRGADAEALDIWDEAYGRALDDWTNLLWQAPWTQTKEEAS